MKHSTHEWVKKAESDWRITRQLLKVAVESDFDAVCFHAQQCAEKYIKGVLNERGISFPKSHDLAELVKLVDPAIAILTGLRQQLEHLTQWSVSGRYPGFFADEFQGKQSCSMAREVRLICRQELGLSEPDLFTDRPESSSE